MSNWWKKGVAFPSNNPNFIRIIDFYLFNCPVVIITPKKDGSKKIEKVSQRAVTFEEREWIGGKITTFLSQMKKNLEYIEVKDDSQTVEECRASLENSFLENKKSSEYIVFKKDYRINCAKSIFYSIRNSLAHGSFSVKGEKNPLYYFENEKNGVKAQICLHENTLLKWIDMFDSTAEKIRKENEELRKQKAKQNRKVRGKKYVKTNK